MKIVVIKDMSAGNESVGEMWQETKIFEPEQPISDVLKWVHDAHKFPGIDWERATTKRITITVAHE
jgi:hypothetical protein